MNSSDLPKSLDLQSASLPGRLRRRWVTDFRLISVAASRDASRARAAITIRDTILSDADMFELSQPSRAGRTKLSTPAVSSGLLSFSLVCPWNIGSRTKTLRMPTIPSRMSSAVMVTPLSGTSCVSM